jgi:hypothetical protein
MATQPDPAKKEPKGKKVVVTPGAVVIPLDEELQRRAQECLAKSGRVTFTFREISVTDLTGIANVAGDPVLID